MNDVSKISVKDLNVSFGDTQALKNVSLEIKSNEVLTIIGPANSGKSSLLLSINRMIDRIENVSLSGSILIDGCNVYAGQNVENLRRRVGMVFALPISLPMSIRDNVLFGIRMLRHVARHDGDVLVVDRSVDAEHGDIVVAAVGGEFTVKELCTRPSLMLLPRNPAYKPIRPRNGEELDIFGVVTNVIRQMKRK